MVPHLRRSSPGVAGSIGGRARGTARRPRVPPVRGSHRRPSRVDGQRPRLVGGDQGRRRGWMSGLRPVGRAASGRRSGSPVAWPGVVQGRVRGRGGWTHDGYQVLEADNGAEGLKQVDAARPSLVLLEVALPDASGFDVCRELRKKDSAVPVIMMSSRSDEIDAVVALEIGADDYVVKPLRLRELAARIAAHLRRMRIESAETTRNRLEFRDLVIDVNERRIYRGGQEVELTHTEFDLLTFLASNAG